MRGALPNASDWYASGERLCRLTGSMNWNGWRRRQSQHHGDVTTEVTEAVPLGSKRIWPMRYWMTRTVHTFAEKFAMRMVNWPHLFATPPHAFSPSHVPRKNACALPMKRI